MIPTLQLDPSTLAIWFNANLLNSYRGEERGLEVFTHAANHDLNKLYPILDAAASDMHRAHYYEIISAVWHEKRHFVDFLLTNFGALHVRTYFQMYHNLPPGLKELPKDTPLLLPLDIYADPVKLMGLGEKGEPPAQTLKLARWLRTRKRGLRIDMSPYDGGRGLTEHGGLAQMEAIAYSCQLGLLQYELGTDAIELLHRYSPLPSVQSRRYAWARDFWAHLPPHPGFPVSADIVDMNLMLAIMVASLCGRVFTLAGEPEIPADRTAPSWRLLKLFTAERWDKYAGASSEEIWARVDAKVKELWGFTVEEELQQDWEIESRLLSGLSSADSESVVVRTFAKYHATRKIVIDDFIASPPTYTSISGYMGLLIEGVSPLQIVCSPSGQQGEPAAIPLFDYDFSHLGSHPLLKGWHAVVNPNASDGRGAKISIGFDHDWKSIVTEFSPVTKLLVSGRAQRLMLGAELDRGETLLKKIGFKMKFMPPYDKLDQLVNGDDYRHLTGMDQAKCDFTGEVVSAKDFDFISPWEIRDDRAFRGFLTYIGEQMNSEQMAALTIAKDWSYWLTSKERAKALRSRFGLIP
ncbi:hypothetical protein [Bradyrhizobium uaiense]|uniref:Uncharacterized protein n=1 Tax=Bradyrhizobium uaiense TaxID=2594946 RepID=A0A6P1BPJ1_9BRAD|nr:hypothetical protein [Bradyrhizobium uaiense]NEV00104.1 hypothetical protein [Bradyrhizobium uaiense]